MTSGFLLENGVLTVGTDHPYIRCQQFAGRDDIIKVIVPQGIGFFEEECFSECPNLEEVVLPDGIINIGIAVFNECNQLRSVNIPSSVKAIEEGAFLSCESLQRILLPEGLERICDLAFQSSGLESITVPETVTYIGEDAFFDCQYLSEANVLGAGTEICSDAFGCCPSLLRGYIAPGFPAENTPASELTFSLLWAGCPGRHSAETGRRAAAYIKSNEGLVMDWVMKSGNLAALSGIVSEKLIDPGHIDMYVRSSAERGLTEITALLLKAKGDSGKTTGEFEL